MTQEEYKYRLAKLFSNILAVDITKVQTERFAVGGTMRSEVFSMCCVNGVYYVALKDIGCFDKWQLIKGGNFEESDFEHFRSAKSGRIVCFLKSAALFKNRLALYKLTKSSFYGALLIAIARKAEDVSLNNSIDKIDVAEVALLRSRAVYSERLKIMAEQRKLNMKERKELLQKIELKLENNTDNANERLKELVSEIESMGWIVTLKLKENE